MKNIHLILTDKPSRLQLNVNTRKLILFNNIQSENESVHLSNQNMYITSNEEIQEGDWVIDGYILRHPDLKNKFNGDTNPIKKLLQKGDLWKFYDGTSGYGSTCKKIILTTDPILIADGVQSIDDEFLEWFVKNPTCEFVEVDEEKHFEVDKSKRANPLNGFYYLHKIIIPQEEPKQVTPEGFIQDISNNLGKTIPETLEHIENFSKDLNKLKSQPKQETLEEAIDRIAKEDGYDIDGGKVADFVDGMVKGAKWQTERMYSEDEVRALIIKALTHNDYDLCGSLATRDWEIRTANFNVWFEHNKK